MTLIFYGNKHTDGGGGGGTSGIPLQFPYLTYWIIDKTAYETVASEGMWYLYEILDGSLGVTWDDLFICNLAQCTDFQVEAENSFSCQFNGKTIGIVQETDAETGENVVSVLYDSAEPNAVCVCDLALGTTTSAPDVFNDIWNYINDNAD